MSRPHTMESFEALPDDAARDAAMARALGWRLTTRMEPDRCEHEPGGGYFIPCWVRGNVGGPEPERDDPNVWWCDTPPPIFTGGDADPFANWHLLAEVMRLLGPDETWLDSPTEPAPEWRVGIMTLSAGGQDGSTPHRAACLCAVEDGLVRKEDSAQ